MPNSVVGPNTFIIGAPKTGTTALAQHLAGHEAIFVSNPKEPFYLSETDLPGLAEQHGLRTDDDYLALFAAGTGTPVRIDASTTSIRSAAALKLAEDLTARSAKYIVGLRHPARLAHAFHSEQVFQLNEREPDFEKAWRRAEAEVRTHESEPFAQFRDYRAVASIGTQLTDLLASIDRHRVLVYVQEEMIADPAQLYREVLDFLSLPDDGRDTIDRVNGNRQHRFPALSKLILDPPPLVARPMQAARARLNSTENSGVAWVKSKLRPPTERDQLSPEFRAELDAHFADEVSLAERAIGRRIEAWHQ